MEVTVHIPDTIGERLGKGTGEIPRWLLEKAGLEAYRAREISGYELRLMLGLKSRLALDAFLKTHGVYLEYSDEDFRHDAETSRQLKLKQAQADRAHPQLFRAFLDAHFQSRESSSSQGG